MSDLANFRPRRPHGIDQTQRPIYVFGYGSLIERASRTATSPQAQVAFPVLVTGVRRGWFDQIAGARGLTPTYLGAVQDGSARTNGVVYAVSEAELQQYKERETGYRVVPLNASQFEFLDGRTDPPDADFYFFETTAPQPPNAQHPIVQSYVDIVMTGALEQEANYPLAKQTYFTEFLVHQTTDWSPHWINDRVHPYRPFVTVPDAYEIDGILSAAFPFYPGRPPS